MIVFETSIIGLILMMAWCIFSLISGIQLVIRTYTWRRREKELLNKIQNIKSNYRMIDTLINRDYGNGNKAYITETQRDLVKDIISILQEMNWQIKLNSYKKVNFNGVRDPLIRYNQNSGKAVKICPCSEEYEGKTFFGIYLGDIAYCLSKSIDVKGDLNIERSFYNPAIFVPELNKIIFGFESWWGIIDKEEDLKDVITEETIKNVWYVKLLNTITQGENNES